MATFLSILGSFVSIVLIGIILLQRGRGGGLVGALSGLGGQSAFGTKAGDIFTRITIGIAAVWVILAGLEGQALRASKGKGKFQGNQIELQDKDTGASKSKKSSDAKKVDNTDLLPSEDDKQDGSKGTSEGAATPKTDASKTDDADRKSDEKSTDDKSSAVKSDEPKADPKSEETLEKGAGDSGGKKPAESK